MVVGGDEVICVVEFCTGLDAVVVVDGFSVVECSVVDMILKAVDVEVISVVESSVVDISLEVVGRLVVVVPEVELVEVGTLVVDGDEVICVVEFCRGFDAVVVVDGFSVVECSVVDMILKAVDVDVVSVVESSVVDISLEVVGRLVVVELVEVGTLVVDGDEVICVVEFCRGFDTMVVVDGFSVVELSVVDMILEAIDVDVISVVESSIVDISLEVVGRLVVFIPEVELVEVGTLVVDGDEVICVVEFCRGFVDVVSVVGFSVVDMILKAVYLDVVSVVESSVVEISLEVVGRLVVVVSEVELVEVGTLVVDEDEVICVVEFCRGFDAVVVVDGFSVVELSVVDTSLEAVDVDVPSVVESSVVDISLKVVGRLVVVELVEVGTLVVDGDEVICVVEFCRGFVDVFSVVGLSVVDMILEAVYLDVVSVVKSSVVDISLEVVGRLVVVVPEVELVEVGTLVVDGDEVICVVEFCRGFDTMVVVDGFSVVELFVVDTSLEAIDVDVVSVVKFSVVDISLEVVGRLVVIVPEVELVVVGTLVVD